MRLAAGLFLSAFMILRPITALGADYVSPTSWFGFPGTMLNADKTFTVWFPAKPAIKQKEVRIGGNPVPETWYYTLRDIAVFEVSDLDFSKQDAASPEEAYIAYLRSGRISNFKDAAEPFGTRQGHRISYGFAEHSGDVTMRMVASGKHLYVVGVVLPINPDQATREEAEHFVNSLALFDGDGQH